MARIASVHTHKGDAAGRAGLGAVMGSKKLKAVVARGNKKVPVADIETANRLRKEQTEDLNASGFLPRFHQYGTGGHGDTSAHSGDTPVRNWGGVGVIDIPDVSGLHKDMVIANLDKRTGCWRCPAACKGFLKAGIGEYKYPGRQSPAGIRDHRRFRGELRQYQCPLHRDGEPYLQLLRHGYYFHRHRHRFCYGML